MIRAVVFDFGQTLVDSSEGFRIAERELQLKARKALGPAAGEEFLDIYREIRASFQARSCFSPEGDPRNALPPLRAGPPIPPFSRSGKRTTGSGSRP